MTLAAVAVELVLEAGPRFIASFARFDAGVSGASFGKIGSEGSSSSVGTWQLRFGIKKVSILGFVAGEPGLPLVIPSFADFGSGPGFLLDRPECEIEGSWIDGTEVHLMTSEPLVSGPQRLAL